jgi:hypothetical protein
VLDGSPPRLGIHELHSTHPVELPHVMADVPERVINPPRKLERARRLRRVCEFQHDGQPNGVCERRCGFPGLECQTSELVRGVWQGIAEIARESWIRLD